MVLLASLFAHSLNSTSFAAERVSPVIGLSTGTSGGNFGQEVQGLSGGVSEFFFRRDRDDVLVPVFMVGEVSKPGIYHVPVKSDLVTLLSIAGGLSPNADHSSIIIRDSRQQDALKVSMEDVVRDSKLKSRVFLGNEIVYVEKSEPWISNNTMLVIGFLSAMIGVVVGAKALSK